MINNTFDPNTLAGTDVMGSGGQKIGTVDGVYLDDQTSRPEWVAVKSGLFGTHVSLVPLAEATHEGGALTVPYDKDQIKAAPHHDPSHQLSPTDEADLYQHYGVQYGGADQTAGTRPDTDPNLAGEARTQGHDTSGPTTDDAMTRSEERLHVGTEAVAAGTARLRKYVVTEDVSKTVPVSHEEVRVEREPITDANRDQALSGVDISEEEHEVTLHAERPVVEKEAVPVERVRLSTETVTEEHTVNEQVRKEQIETPDHTQR